jgi:hypothetical protein
LYKVALVDPSRLKNLTIEFYLERVEPTIGYQAHLYIQYVGDSGKAEPYLCIKMIALKYSCIKGERGV